MPWYCARLAVVCIVGERKPRKRNTCDYPFFFLSMHPTMKPLFQRALLNWQAEEETRHTNMAGKPVRWAFQQDEIKERP